MSNILGNMPPVFGSGYRGVVPAPSAADVSAQNILRADGTWGAGPSGTLPSQTGNAGELLTTDGTNASWASSLNTFQFGDVTLGSSGPSVKSTLSARAPRQGLVFDGTAGATHSNITLGSGDFTVAIWARVPTTSAANRQLLGSSGGDTALFLDTTGLAKIYISGQTTHTASSVVPDQKSVLIVYTRSGTSGTFYQNAVSNGTVTDSNNYSTAWSYFGARSGGGYTTGTLIPLIYNRALSASEVVSLYEAGAPAGADYGQGTNDSGATVYSGQQMVNGDNSTFASDTGWWTKASGVSITGGKLVLSSVATGSAAILRNSVLKIGIRYRVTFTISNYSAGGVKIQFGGTSGTTRTANGTYTEEVVCGSSNTNLYPLVTVGTTTLDVDDLTVTPSGLLLAPDAAQAGGGLVWYDTSGNAANITLPASGVSWNVPSSLKLGGNWTAAGNLNASGGFYVSGSSVSPNNTACVDLSFQTTYGKVSAINRGVGNFPLALNPEGGSVLVNTTTNSGNGAVQLATHTTSAGGIGFGTDVSVYRDTNSTLNGTAPGGYALTRTGINGVGLATGVNVASDAKTANDAIGISLSLQNSSSAAKTYGQIYAEINSATASSENGSLVLRTIKAGTLTTALTLDSSQNATFAGAVTAQQLNAVDAAANNRSAAIIRAQNNTTYSSSVLSVQGDRTTTNSTYNLILAQNAAVTGQFIVRDSGNVVNTNNSYGAISDRKLKENIVDTAPKLAEIAKIQIRDYNLIGKTETQTGVIAQELETVFPSLVESFTDRDAEGNDLGTVTKTVKYSQLVPLLVKALQELRIDFETYKAAHP